MSHDALPRQNSKLFGERTFTFAGVAERSAVPRSGNPESEI